MKVSIVIPTYNVERYILETLSSVGAQTHENWEAIVVDDGSSDGTVGLVSSFPDPRVRLICQTNQGGAAARENGFALRSPASEAVLFFDHDDRLRPDGLSLLVRGLEGSLAAHGLAAYMDSDGQSFRPGKYEAYLRKRVVPEVGRLRTSDPTTFEALTVRNLIPLGAILIRNEAKERVGQFDPSFGYSHDWELWLRLSLLGPISFVNKVIYDYRIHDQSMSRTSSRFAEDDAAVWKKYISSPSIPVDKREATLRGFQFAQRDLLRKKRPKALRRALRMKFDEARRIWQDSVVASRQFTEADLG